MLTKGKRKKYNQSESRKIYLAYQARCRKMLAHILSNKNIDLGKHPHTTAKMLDFLFISVIEDQEKRRSKLRQIFRGKIAIGDDLYLRIAWDYVRNAPQTSRNLTKKYRGEIESKSTMTEAKMKEFLQYKPKK